MPFSSSWASWALGRPQCPMGLWCRVGSTKGVGWHLGLMLVGVSSGAIAMPSVAQRLIAVFGWRATYSILGFAVLAVSLPVVGIFLKNSPAEIGTTPDGATLLNSRPERRSDQEGLTWPAARRES